MGAECRTWVRQLRNSIPSWVILIKEHGLKGSEGIILVQVPFLMADFSHIKAILGSFLENLAKFTKKLNIPPSLITSL